MSWEYKPGSKVKRYYYDSPDDLEYLKAQRKKRELQIANVENAKLSARKQKKSGWDQEKYESDMAAAEQALVDLDKRGINKKSLRIRELEALQEKGWSGWVTDDILKNLKAGINTSRRSEDNPTGRSGEKEIIEGLWSGDDTSKLTPEQQERMKQSLAYMKENRSLGRNSSSNNPYFNERQEPSKGNDMTKGELATMSNAYEPGLITSQNSFNTQATRDVSAGKSGVVGNTKAGDAVYDPKSKTRKAVQSKLNKRRKGMLARRTEQLKTQAQERIR